MNGNHLRIGLLAMAAFAGCGLTAAWAQGGAPDTDTAGMVTRAVTTAQNLTWEEILENGGWPLKVLFAISVAGLASVLYLLYVLRQEQVVPRGVLQDVLTRIAEGSFNEARLACSHRPCPLAAVALAAINYVQSVPRPDPQMLKEVIESEGRRQATAIQGPTFYLLDISAVGPMVGLLGTVLGMLNAFKGVASEIAQARPQILADGVSMALITTAAGLMVGIPALVFYALFRGRAARQIGHLEAASMEILTTILQEREEHEVQ